LSGKTRNEGRRKSGGGREVAATAPTHAVRLNATGAAYVLMADGGDRSGRSPGTSAEIVQ